ncbi:hypothetical protein EU537_10855 [Candidatus Thorarchaeota archaeon]|nr:MAG: hypothetical protein EU537_10855 [Candidatus Thorarchaeota archaeon]
MSRDADVQELALVTRKQLVEEFAEKHSDLSNRIERLRVDLANAIVEETKCPVQMALVAYLIEMDGIMGAKQAVELLTNEINRRNHVGESVPNLPGNVQEFAIQEGRWLEYLYGGFTSKLESKVRNLSNLENVLEEDNPPVEKAISIFNTRTRISEGFIMPIAQTWFDEHPKANSEDLVMVFGQAITNWMPTTLRGKIISLRRRSQALYRRLGVILSTASDSIIVEAMINQIEKIVDDFDSRLEDIAVSTASHFILHLAPRPLQFRGDRSKYVSRGMSSLRGNKTEPDMTSPFDFLERDVRLAKRRKGEDRELYLKNKVPRVIRVLIHQGTPIDDAVEKAIVEMQERLKLPSSSLEDIDEEIEIALNGVPPDEQEQAAAKLVIKYVRRNFYGDTSQ